MKLTVFNPTVNALRNLDGLKRIGGYSSLKNRIFCWTCQKDKPATGSTKKGHHDGSAGFSKGAPVRPTCADCLQAKAAKKALCEKS